MSAVSKKVAWSFLFVGAMLTTIMVSRYLTMNPEVYFPEQVETYQDHPIGIMSHIIGGMLAMFLGPFQFIEGLRKKRPALHRAMGRIYLLGVLMGGCGGLYMAIYAFGGFPARLGFASLATLWLATGTLALLRVRTRDFAAHREWMIRSFALTLAAFTLRIYSPIYAVLSATELTTVTFQEAYIAIAWIAWVPNLIVAEWYINSTRVGRKAAKS